MMDFIVLIIVLAIIYFADKANAKSKTGVYSQKNVAQNMSGLDRKEIFPRELKHSA